MTAEPRLLVVDGYSRAGREELTAGGASTGGELYVRMLRQCAPRGCVVDVLHPADPGVELPAGAGLQSYDGIAWSGSSLSLTDGDETAVAPQLAFARAAFAAKVPSFGSCWAAQIAVVAAGGRCARNPRGREMGLARKIALTDAGRGHPMYAGKVSVFDAFTSHEDEITHLPPGAVVLASNAFTPVQSVAVTHHGGTCWGVQYHPEYDLHDLARLTFCRIPKLIKMGFFADRTAALVYVEQLEALHTDPSRNDLAWLLGIDADVLNPDVRCVEVRNWIERLVLPSMKR
jgi:GMP synthase (glutamine-hydrolysing)